MDEQFFYERYAEFYSSKYGEFIRKIDTTGPFTLIDACQGSGDLSGTTTNEILFVRTMSRGIHDVDFGNGSKKEWWNPGNFSVCPANFHNRVISEQMHRLQIIAIHFPALKELLNSSGVDFDGDFGQLHSRQISGGTLSQLWGKLFRCRGSQDSLSCESIALDLALHVLGMAGRHKSVSRPKRERLSKRAMSIAIDRLRAPELPCPTLAELAALTCLSSNHFCRAFKAETGMPPHRFHVAGRIDQAKKMLQATELSISEIAASLGLHEQSYFSRCFLKETGLSPSSWRDLAKTELPLRLSPREI
jgi:AraC family transcriptional regulator